MSWTQLQPCLLGKTAELEYYVKDVSSKFTLSAFSLQRKVFIELLNIDMEVFTVLNNVLGMTQHILPLMWPALGHQMDAIPPSPAHDTYTLILHSGSGEVGYQTCEL